MRCCVMLEIEFKAYTDDLIDVENKIRCAGGEFISEEIEIDYYFTAPFRDFSKKLMRH